jgi:DNA repair exonuclease SbcCD ATPase subunit
VQLSGKNFQAWADFDLSIEGLCVVTGPSDAGKSALFRALKGVLRNELPAEFVRDGQDESMRVEVDYNNHVITAHRSSKGSTKYVIDGKDYAKLAGGVPDALKDLKFGEVVIGDFDVDPIFGRQNSAQFLIDPTSYKPTEVNAILGAFGGTEKLEQGKKEANLRKTQKDAEARTIATQIRDAEERKATLTDMQAHGQAVSDTLHRLEKDIRQLETEAHWLEIAVKYRQGIVPLRQIMDALVLPDVTGLDNLLKLVTYADQADEAARYAKWLQKPASVLYSVSVLWNDAKTIWNQIAAVEGAIAAGRHVVSTDQLKTSLSGAETAYSEAVRLWRSITAIEVLAALLGEITDSAEKLAGVEIELSAAQAELRKGLCPKCGKPLEHACA